MAHSLKAFGFTGILIGVLATSVSAPRAAEAFDAVPEGRGVMIDLGSDTSAITYWASEAGNMHVVTTVDTLLDQDERGEKHAVVRFASDLLPGQSQLISVPVAIGERQQMLRIRRVGDRIEMTRVPASDV
jgi:hypothetical protein